MTLWTLLWLWVVFESFRFEPPASHLELWAILFILLGLFCSQPQDSYPESRVVSPWFQVVLLQAVDLSSLGRSLHILRLIAPRQVVFYRGSSPLFSFFMIWASFVPSRRPLRCFMSQGLALSSVWTPMALISISRDFLSSPQLQQFW